MRIAAYQQVALLLCVLVGCTSAPPPSTQIVPASAVHTQQPALEFTITDFPDARSHSLVSGPEGHIYLIYGQEQSLFVSRSTDGGQTFGDPVLATGDNPVHVLPIEHPAIAVDNAGRVHIAWLEMPPDFEGAEIWYAFSQDHGETFGPAELIATEPAGEVAMVQIATDPEGNPIFTWLNEGELILSRSADRGSTFSETLRIGQGACECCQPQAIVLGENIYIAYRSLEPGNEKGDIRDIVMIHSADGGQVFGPITRVSDAHWYLPACPIAGPSLVLHDDTFYITWMDGRFEPAGSFTRGDIWLAISRDHGQTFSPDIRINADQDTHHTLPAIAVGPEGRIHIVWEAQKQGTHEAFLYYTNSDDGGLTFTSPQVISDNTDSARGNPGKPVIIADTAGYVTLAWLDRRGVRIAAWTDTK